MARGPTEEIGHEDGDRPKMSQQNETAPKTEQRPRSFMPVEPTHLAWTVPTLS
jgi:hypothetical protein